MAIWIFSVDGFPGSRESGRHTEYCEVLGTQVIFPPGEWVRLKQKYERPYWTDFKHRGEGTTNQAVAHARKDIFTGDEIAVAIVKKYGAYGVVSLEDDPETHPRLRQEKEDEAKVQANRYHEYIVSRFEDERKARQLTGRGRLEPTAWELTCYRLLGLPQPGSLEAVKAERNPEVKVELPPEIADLVAEGLAARRAAQNQVGKT